ncbi:BON domain-containing protein [Algoriphagus persicinus]|uniref:BON domain-containing protein n=1 Tax=Algoriphagus persicinus TaxID=3108754 RepID=UPI002B3EB5C7|nr:BON domain-containing protein [Algoriphagus sp. E1-3-M2]MEB2785257.1 BON domain-containing protein [Algoriphagus sp. E1-3-M2]
MILRLKPKDIDLIEIQHKITAAIHRRATVDATAIKLKQKGDKMILRGSVRSWVEKKEAGRIAWSYPGVKSVENHIMVGTRVFA